MATLELKAYEIFKGKLGPQEAETVIESIESKVDKSVERSVKHLATKEDVASLETKITKVVYAVGFVQFLAIIGSLLATLNFMNK